MRAVPTYANTGTVRFRHLWKLRGSLHAWRWIVWALFSSGHCSRPSVTGEMDGRTLDRDTVRASTSASRKSGIASIAWHGIE